MDQQTEPELRRQVMTERIVNKSLKSTELEVPKAVTAVIPDQPRLVRSYPGYGGINQQLDRILGV